MRLGAVLQTVVTYQEVHEPGIGFFLILRFVKVVEGFVHLLRQNRPDEARKEYARSCRLGGSWLPGLPIPPGQPKSAIAKSIP
jgi:hypothetical protein